MPIEVFCPGCKTRFRVSDKFAGKKGPCPKCKTVITIPEKTPEVVVHAPQEFGPKNAAGVGVLKPIARKEAKLSPLTIVGILSGIIVVLVVALVLRGLEQVSPWIRGIGALALAPPLVLGGYTFLRDDELEPYRGLSLALRVAVCSVGYAALWAVYAYVPATALNLDQLELLHLLFIVPLIFAAGAFIATLTLDLDFTNGIFHYGFYVVVTVALALLVDIDLLSVAQLPVT
jgi:predicted Zn finger-like uncharacterized protein